MEGAEIAIGDGDGSENGANDVRPAPGQLSVSFLGYTADEIEECHSLLAKESPSFDDEGDECDARAFVAQYLVPLTFLPSLRGQGRRACFAVASA